MVPCTFSSLISIIALRKQVGALIKALPDFANVALFFLFVFYLFGTLGLYQYNGILYNRCRLNPIPESDMVWKVNETETRVCSQNVLGNF
jgi:hypothetical protein